MAVQVISPSNSTVMEVDATPKAGRVILYDALGNALVRTAGAQSTLANQTMVPVGGFDSIGYARPARSSILGHLRNTSDTILFHDGFEGSTINSAWVQSASTMTIAQATGVLTLNNGASTAANLYAIVTSARQFAKYPRQPLHCHFRAKLNTLSAGHEFAELGIGAPSGATAVINNGAFWRIASSGTVYAVISVNGSESPTAITGPANTIDYYDYDIYVDEVSCRFLLRDSNGTVISDNVEFLAAAATTWLWAVSHLPAFARVYSDGTGGGTAQQILLAAHEVSLFDVLTNKPWAHQLSSCGRQAALSPTAYTQTDALASSAPGGGAPSNTTSLYTTLGGEYIATMTAANENMLSLFAYQIPTPYTFYLTGLYFSVPVVSTIFSILTTGPTLLPFIIQNCSSANISSGNGIHIPLPGLFSGGTATAVGTQLTGSPISWSPQTPIALYPGLYFHIGWKSLFAGTVTTGAIRGVVTVDGYWE